MKSVLSVSSVRVDRIMLEMQRCMLTWRSSPTVCCSTELEHIDGLDKQADHCSSSEETVKVVTS